MRTAIISIILLTISIVIYHVYFNHEKEVLLDLVEIAENNKLNIKKWQVTYKENIEKSELHAIIKEMERYGDVTVTEEEKFTKYSLNYIHKMSSLSESFSLVFPHEGDSLEWVIVLESDQWNKKIAAQYEERTKEILELNFTNNRYKFACIQTETDDIIEDGTFLSELQKQMNLQNIEIQNEEVSKSLNRKVIYGYTPRWREKINFVDNPMNMQVAMTDNKHNGTTLTIGTPILINEY